MSHAAPPATATQPDSLELRLGSMSQLFCAPSIDPFSSRSTEILGISGVEYLLGLLHMDSRRQQSRRLVIQMPPDPSHDAGAATEALHRYAQLRLDRERRELLNTYRYGWRVTVVAIVILAICLAISSLFASDMTAWMRPLPRKTLEYGFEIVGWVTLWHPVDVLLFAPLPIRYRIQALQTLASVEVVIQSLMEPRAPGTVIEGDAIPVRGTKV